MTKYMTKDYADHLLEDDINSPVADDFEDEDYLGEEDNRVDDIEPEEEI